MQIIWSQGKWHWQRTRRPGHARTCKQKGRRHAGVPSASLEVMSGWFGALEVCSRVVLKNSEQMASAAQRQKMPIICWNPFILLLYLQTDWEQCHLVQMNEPVSPLMFLSAEGPFRMGRSGNPLIVFLVYWWEWKYDMILKLAAWQRRGYTASGSVSAFMHLHSCCCSKSQSIKTLHWCEDWTISWHQRSHWQQYVSWTELSGETKSLKLCPFFSCGDDVNVWQVAKITNATCATN